MQIDRARFLLLTASLAGAAGAGCSAGPSEGPATPSPTTTPPAATTGAVATDPDPDPSADPVVAVPTSEPVATAEPVPTAAPISTAAGACNNDEGTVPACSIAAPPGPFCEGLSDAKATCKGYKTSLRPAVAAKAVACLNAGSGKQAICDWQLIEACSIAAVRTACVEPTTASSCNTVVSQCAATNYNKLTQNDCQALLSAVKPTKKQSMITCMTEGCSLDSCTWMLR